jgi:hypothetical protein
MFGRKKEASIYDGIARVTCFAAKRQDLPNLPLENLLSLGAGDFPGYLEIYEHFLQIGEYEPAYHAQLMDYYGSYEIKKVKADDMPQSGDQQATDVFINKVCKSFPHAAYYHGFKNLLNVYIYVIEFGSNKARKLPNDGIAKEKKLMVQCTEPLQDCLEDYAAQVAKAFREVEISSIRRARIRRIGEALDDNISQLLVCHRAVYLNRGSDKPVVIREMEYYWDGCGGWRK